MQSLLNQVRTKSEPITMNGKTFNIILSCNSVIDIEGFVVGLKFSDATGSMDSSKAKPANGIRVGVAIAHRAIQMIKPDLDNVGILGFYLLTDDLDALRPGGSRGEIRLYTNQARIMQHAFKEKLQHLTNFEVKGGNAWVLSEKP